MVSFLFNLVRFQTGRLKAESKVGHQKKKVVADEFNLGVLIEIKHNFSPQYTANVLIVISTFFLYELNEWIKLTYYEKATKI